jgi:hypothetical protein
MLVAAAGSLLTWVSASVAAARLRSAAAMSQESPR